MKKFLITILAALLALPSLKAQHGEYVGGDISNLPLYEQHNSGYLDMNGQKIDDLIQWLKNECGWNTFRVRLFVNPNGKSNDGSSVDPSVCQDLEYVKALGSRIKAAGAYFMLDFHYSDTWMDATHIQAPAAWSGLSTADKALQVGTYTRECLEALVAAGAQPDLVQVGNEIMYGFVGVKVAPYDQTSSNWDGFLSILKAGCNAVRSTCPQAQIIVHTDRPGNASYANYWYGKLDAAQVDYDIIGLSYYPFWHGTLNDLKNGLNNLKSKFPNKKVQIVETGYYFQYWPTSGVNYNTQSTWAASPAGQYKFVSELVSALADYEQVNGLMYWFPEDAGNGDDTNWNSSKGTCLTAWTNRGLWWPSQSNTGHWPVTCDQGFAGKRMKDFLDPNVAMLGTIDAESTEAAIYDILGRRVNRMQPNMIYFRNGHKYIQK